MYYIETDMGCGIRRTKREANEELKAAQALGLCAKVRKATKDDTDRVRNMGGYVPEKKTRKKA